MYRNFVEVLGRDESTVARESSLGVEGVCPASQAFGVQRRPWAQRTTPSIDSPSFASLSMASIGLFDNLFSFSFFFFRVVISGTPKSSYGGLWSPPPKTRNFGPRRGRMKDNLTKRVPANLVVEL